MSGEERLMDRSCTYNRLESSVHGKPILAMSVDVEPWWSSELAVDGWGPVDEGLPSQVRAILDLFDEVGGRATFFILGEVAERRPEIVAEIRRSGHEIASHGYDHTSLHRLTPAEFRRREAKTRSILISLTGEGPLGFRAPNYSLQPSTSWVYKILEDLEYRYSSSLFPMRTPLYGWPGMPFQPFLPGGEERKGEEIPRANLVEFPVAVYSRLGIKIPICGGGYLRYQPTLLVAILLRRVARERLAVFDIHPRDLFPPPTKRELGLLPRLALCGSLGDTWIKFRKLSCSFHLRPIRDFLP